MQLSNYATTDFTWFVDLLRQKGYSNWKMNLYWSQFDSDGGPAGQTDARGGGGQRGGESGFDLGDLGAGDQQRELIGVGSPRDIATVVAENRVNMSALEVHVYDDKTAVVSATVEIDSLAQLSRLMEKLEGVKDVHTVAREAS